MGRPRQRAGRRWSALAAMMLAACPGTPGDGGRAVDGPRLHIDLRVAARVYRVGDRLEYTAALVNDGASPAVVVLPGDGSDCGWRTPVVTWQPPAGGGPRCGNVNALAAHEVRELGPGERVELDAWLGQPMFAVAGRCAVAVQIENVPDLDWQGLPLGEHDAATMARVRRTKRFTARSNVVEVTVEPAAPGPR